MGSIFRIELWRWSGCGGMCGKIQKRPMLFEILISFRHISHGHRPNLPWISRLLLRYGTDIWQRPWSPAMASGHVVWAWPWAMALGHGLWPSSYAMASGPSPWSWPLATAQPWHLAIVSAHSIWPWPWIVALGHGLWPRTLAKAGNFAASAVP